MLNELDVVKTKGLREKLDYALVKPVIWLKHKLGLGIDGQSPSSKARARELHKPIVRKFKKRRVFVSNINKIWTADLMDRQKLSRQNKGYKYLLNVIDLFSRYAYSVPLKTKSADEVMNAFKKLFFDRSVEKLWTDQGTEFTNKKFKDYLDSKNIELYHVHNDGKACVAERFNRTLGDMIERHLTETDSKKYIDKLQELVSEYNHKYHKSIKMSPIEALNPDNLGQVAYNLYARDKIVESKIKFKVGDRVRVGSYKTIFTKGYKPRWTKEIFVVSEVLRTNPVTYKIVDSSGEKIIGSYYTQELQHTKFLY